jgi:NADH dehydrogenase
MKGQIISVFGGSGFLGSYIVRGLLAAGAYVKIYSDNPNNALPLKVSASLGQLKAYKINICDHNAVKEAITGSTTVINLIGIKCGSAKQLFVTHVLFPKLLAKYSKQLNISKLIHFSAIGVDKIYESTYAHSKYEGDQCVRREFSKSIIIRPGLVFGQNDHFINRLYFLLPRFPIFPMLDKMNVIKPMYAGDVAKVLMLILKNYEKYQGKTLELSGQKSYSMKSIISMINNTLRKNIKFISLPTHVFRIYVLLSRCFPEPIMNKENTHLLRYNGRNIKNHLKQMNITSTDLESFISSYEKKIKNHDK